MITCKDCVHAEWTLTPTGRIKKKVFGRCGKDQELKEMVQIKKHIPCIVMTEPHTVVIWPDYNASRCPRFIRLKDKA